MIGAGHGNSYALSELAWLRREVEDRLGPENPVGWHTNHPDANELRALFRERAESRVRRSLDFDIGDTHGMYAVLNARDLAFKLAAWADDRGDADALWALAKPWSVAGDQAELDPNGDTDGPWALAKLREEAGDQAGAEDLYCRAVNRGDTSAPRALAKLREKTGDQTGADRIRRFGLTGPGKVATKLDFDARSS